MAVELATGTVVVLTPMQLECREMLRHLRGGERVWHAKGTFAQVGRIDEVPWQVAVVVAGEGNLRSAVLAERLASWFRPVALLVVGIAGALKADIDIGDVVVGTRIHGYQGGRQDDAGFHARPQSYPADSVLVDVARAVDLDGAWPPNGTAPAVHFKPIAAGDIVLNSSDTPLRDQITHHYNDACAIETESAGSAAAAHLDGTLRALTIRGISDKADGNKHRSDGGGLQPLAAAHAAAFTVGLLRELDCALVASEDGDLSRPLGASRPATAVQTVDAGPGSTVYAVQKGVQNITTRPAGAPPD
ncbi:nucleosidase [Actinomadura darangshiensis]|uniref:Nucleosidase n=1 Tax=Actinomadura darangshiensis TaxID=705336 RepID=A0A4R5ANR8_9ACTN|nr:5'-methylthioadenosine/S-adenosylhomocysteine nucleosidase [Actinomadura darangshiensis]TDD73289.1 nucleosidase [Actinomadura darangshiensis]